MDPQNQIQVEDTPNPMLQQSIHSNSSQRSTIQILQNKISSLEALVQQKQKIIDALKLKLVQDKLGDSFEESNSLFQIKSQLNNIKIKHIQEKQNIKRDHEAKLEEHAASYENLIAEQEQHYERQLEEMALAQKTLSGRIQTLTLENQQLKNRQQSEELSTLKKTNQKLIQQNKQHLQKLYKSLSETSQLRQELFQSQTKCANLAQQIRDKQSLHSRELKKHEELIQSYKIIKEQGRARSRSSNISSSQDEIVTSSIKIQLNSMSKELEQFRDKEKNRQQELINMKQIVKQKQDDNRHVRNQLLQKSQEIFKLKNTLKQKEKPIAQYERTIEQLRNKINQVTLNNQQAKLSNDRYDSEIVPLSQISQPMSIIKKNNSSLKNQNQQLKNSMIDLFSDKESLLNRIVQLQKQNLRLGDEIEKYQAEKNYVGGIGDSIRQEQLAIVKHERDRLFNEKNELRQSLEQNLIRIGDLENQVQKYRAQFQINFIKDKEMKDKVANLQNSLQSTTKQKLNAMQLLSELENQNQLYQQNIRQLTKQKQQKEKKLLGLQNFQPYNNNQHSKTKIQQLEQQKMEFTEQNRQLRHRLEQCETRLISKTKEISELKYEIIQLQAREKVSSQPIKNIVPLSRAHSGKQQTTDRQQSKLKMQNQALQLQKSQLQSQIQELSKDFNKSKKQIQSLKKQMAAKSSTLKSNEQQIQQMKQKLEDQDLEISKSKRQKAKLNDEIKKISAILEEYKQNLEDKKVFSDVLDKDNINKIDRLQIEINNKNKNLQIFQNKLRQLSRQKQSLGQRLKQVESQVQNLQLKNRKADQQVNKLKQENRQNQDALYEMQQKYNNQRLLAQKLDKTQKTGLQIDEKIRKLEQQKYLLEQKFNTLLKKYDDLRSSTSKNELNLKNNYDKLNVQVLSKQGIINDLTKENNSLLSEITLSQHQNSKIKRQLLHVKTVFNSRLETMASEIQQLRQLKKNKKKEEQIEESSFIDEKIQPESQKPEISYKVQKQLQNLKQKYLQLQIENRQIRMKQEKQKRKLKSPSMEIDTYNLQRQVQLLNQIVIQKDKHILQLRANEFTYPVFAGKHYRQQSQSLRQSNEGSYIPRNGDSRPFNNGWKKAYHVFPTTQTRP